MQKVLSPDIEVTSESAVPPPLSVASHPGWRLCLPQAVGQLKYWGLQNLCTKQGKKLKPSSIDRPSPQNYYKPLDMPNKERFTLFGFCFLGAKILQSPVHCLV